MKTALSCLLILFTIFAVAQDVDQPLGSVQPNPDLRDVFIEQRLGAIVPAGATLVDESGKSMPLANLLGKRPIILLPIFYRCAGVCNLELQSLLAALPDMKARIGKDFDIVVMSIDPQEGPDLARDKLAASIAAAPTLKGTEKGWHFLTGTLPAIRSVTDSVGFHYRYEADKDLVNHPSGMIVLTPDGIVSAYLLGAKYGPAALSQDLELASRRKVGKKAEDIFFGCVHLDPVTGHRSIVIEGVLRLAGVVTVIAILGLILVFSRKRLRHAKAGDWTCPIP